MHVEARPREITRVALLDLTGANAEQALVGVTRIADVATILVSENLLARLSRRVGYKQLIVLGQLLAPVGSETALGAGLTRSSPKHGVGSARTRS
jgi:hypothetical protein